ncbi:hypothetical protein CCP4SC76_4100003 [Gammaproteobacteria bacterium]
MPCFVESPDDDLRLQFEAMNELSPEEKAVARTVIEGLLLKHAARQWAGRVNQGSTKAEATKGG